MATLPSQSTGQTTANAQQGRADGASAQNPPVTNDDAPAPTNATTINTAPTTGTNGELRPATSTQGGTTAAPGGPTPGNSGDADAQPGGYYGAAAPSDDSGAGLNSVAQEIQRLYGGTPDITRPKPNPLDRCASYTYNVTLYLTTPTLYNNLLTNKKKSVAGMSVILRSGGIGPTPAVDPQETQQMADGQSASYFAGRNNNFPLDLYLDNLQIKSIINGKGTMSPHNATEINFRVIEPNGITFIQSLQKATAELALNTGDIYNAYLGQVYLMAIRFYGWDENGNPVAPDTNIAAQQSDRTAITEKFIPFIFTGIKFKIANKLAEYDCSAVAVGNMIATGQQRGVIPSNFQVTAGTLKGVLKELETALNSFQNKLCETDPANGKPDPTYTYPDVYEFQLVPPLDSDAITLKPPGNTANTQTAMNPSAQQDPRSALPAAQSVQSTTKLNSAFAGMSIVQFLDQMVRQSAYIYQQQKYINDPKTGETRSQTGVGKLMAWYRVSVQAVPDLEKWDPRRRDYAYKITYQVTPYLVTDVLSDYFPQSPRWTAPKEYQYWFTGQNNSILDFTQDLNNLYYFVVNSSQTEISDSQLKNESKKGYQPASNISSAGMPGKVNEPGANAAQYLYSPADLARARMTILGDPDWIQQGDVWAGIDDPDAFNPSIIYQSGPDAGGINYGSRETVFDIVFKTPADYDMNTGLITDPAAAQPGSTVNGTPRMTEMKTRYKAITVVNNFSQGRFTQEIEGVMVMPDVAKDEKQTAQVQSEKSVVQKSPGTPTLSGPAYTNFRRSEIAEQNASAKPTDWAQGYKNKLPTGARTDSMAAGLSAAAITPSPLLSSAPTSGSETVGPADPSIVSLQSTGGASGRNIGSPTTNLYLNDGQVVSVTTQSQINSYRTEGLVSPQAASAARSRLSIAQQAANSPVSSAPKQLGNREP